MFQVVPNRVIRERQCVEENEEGAIEQMLKIYDKEVFIIELEELLERSLETMRNILKIPNCQGMVFLLKEAGKIIAATNLANFRRNNIVFQTFSDNKRVFLEARDYCIENQVPYDTYFPVLDNMGNCAYLLHYVRNKAYMSYWKDLSCGLFPKYDLDNHMENLDYSLVEKADLYIFSEVEEYTYAIVTFINKKYPNKPIYFLDEKISYFPKLKGKAEYIESIYCIAEKTEKNQCLWVISDGRIYEGVPLEFYENNAGEEGPDFLLKNYGKIPSESFFNVYNSINVLYSMCWCSIRESFGCENKNCHIFLADFQGGGSGLGDYIWTIYVWYSIAKKRGWKFAINLCRRPNQYLMSESENMWDYFFEPLSDLPLDEVYRSASVIRASVNHISMIENGRLPYFRYEAYATTNEVMKHIKFNTDTQNRINELIPEILKKENRVLGVILRGTDYRPEANEIVNRPQMTAQLEQMIDKCKFIMELYEYETLFLATEDLEYFEIMIKEFGRQCLSIDQKRVYYDYHTGYKLCADLLKLENGKEFGRRYLAIVQSLANCKSLLTNVYNNTAWMAKTLNDSKYEYFEVIGL